MTITKNNQSRYSPSETPDENQIRARLKAAGLRPGCGWAGYEAAKRLILDNRAGQLVVYDSYIQIIKNYLKV